MDTGALVTIVMGWPGIIAANVISVIGLSMRNWRLQLLAALVALPFAFYLTANPGTRWAGPLVTLSLFAAALLSQRGNHRFAWLFALPLLIVSLWLATVVLAQ